jgi:hypothetical protein
MVVRTEEDMPCRAIEVVKAVIIWTTAYEIHLAVAVECACTGPGIATIKVVAVVEVICAYEVLLAFVRIGCSATVPVRVIALKRRRGACEIVLRALKP